MNSWGVTFPIALWVRSSLYSRRHASITSWASCRVTNQCSFKHSSRNLPLQLSIKAFCTGSPLGRCSLCLEPYQFFALMAFSVWMSSACSAIICFSRQFSPSSWRSFFTSLTSRPAYFAHHL